MLEALIELGWKSAVIAALALVGDRAMRGRPAAERVFVLRVAVVALLLLPVAMLVLPSLDLALLPAPEVAPQMVRPPVTVAPISAPAVAPGIDLAGLFYALGAGAVLLHLAIGVSVLARWTRRGVEAGEPGWNAALARGTARLRRPVRLLVSGDVASPISWGIAPAWILIDPATLTRVGQADAVVAHEMAHIRRFDWPMLIAARIAVALLWFNPLVWLLNRTLARRGEMAADEVAVRGIERADYAEALLSFATAPAARGVATGMALWPNALAERITHIAMHRQRRGSRAVPAAALMCAAIAAPALAAARLVPAAPAGERVTRPIAAQAGPAGPELRTPASSGEAVAPVPRRAAVQTADTGRNAPSSAARSAESAPVAQPLPVPVAPAAPAVRIVGRNGAEVSVGPQGTTITGEQIEIPPAGSPIVVTGSERPEWAVEAARDLRISAAEMRSGAREVELTAELPGVSAGKRAEIRKRAGEMRARADEFEARARALGGSGG